MKSGPILTCAALLLAVPVRTDGAREPVPAGETDAQEIYQRSLDAGLSAFVDADYDSAVQHLRQALAIRPDDDTAVKTLRSAQRKLSRQRSEETMSELREVEKAQRYFKDKNYLIATIALKTTLRKSPDLPEARAFQRKLEEKLDALLRKQPEGSAQWNSYKGMLAYLADQPGSAVGHWKDALKENPDDPMLALAIEEVQAKPKPKPVTSLVSSPLAPPGEPCDCDLPEGTTSPAAAAKPAPPPAPLASDPKPLPKPPAAAPAPKAAAETPAPAKDASELARAQSLLESRQYRRALELVERFLDSNPDHAQGRRLRERILDQRDEASSRHYQRGLVEYAKGDYNSAIREWKAVLRIDPENSKAKKVLLRAFFKPGE